MYINTGYTNIFAFTTFHLRSKTNAIFFYVPRLFISQDIFLKKHIKMSLSNNSTQSIYFDSELVLEIIDKFRLSNFGIEMFDDIYF